MLPDNFTKKYVYYNCEPLKQSYFRLEPIQKLGYSFIYGFNLITLIIWLRTRIIIIGAHGSTRVILLVATPEVVRRLAPAALVSIALIAPTTTATTLVIGLPRVLVAPPALSVS